MTNEEAIQNLIQISRMYGHKWQQEACDIAIKAIEKQIPKKPILYVTKFPHCCKVLKCPTCGQEFGFNDDFNHCENCGQKIDFENEKQNDESYYMAIKALESLTPSDAQKKVVQNDNK